MRGDVVFADLPYAADRASREQAGRRPAIAVLSDVSPATNPMVMVVPTTSKLDAARFPYTLEVLPSTINGLTERSILLVFQLRALDRNRIRNTVGRLEDHYLAQLDQILRNLLNL